MSLLFCRDGVLRIEKFVPEKRCYAQIPLALYEAEVGPLFLAKIFDPIALEDGLTVRELFHNLAPWADLMSQLAQMDFPAFLAECEKPIRVLDGEPPLSHIDLRAFGSLRAEPAYAKAPRPGVGDGEKAAVHFLCGKPLVTDRYDLSVCWNYSAVYAEPYDDPDSGTRIEHVSLDYTPLDEWHNLPIRIQTTLKLSDGTPLSPHHTAKTTLLNPAHPAVAPITLDDGRLAELTVELNAEPNFYETIVRGFLFEIGFHWTPIVRDEQAEEIRGRVKSVRDKSEGDETGTPSGTVSEAEAANEEDEPSDGLLLLTRVQHMAPDLIRLRPENEDTSDADRAA